MEKFMELAAPPVELTAHTHRPTFMHTQMHRIYIKQNAWIVQVHHKFLFQLFCCKINQLSDSVRVLK